MLSGGAVSLQLSAAMSTTTLPPPLATRNKPSCKEERIGPPHREAEPMQMGRHGIVGIGQKNADVVEAAQSLSLA